ncbi:FKBP12-associated protein [Serendipita sp. 401]|nr:FKBP12-associated protein [Serendipita sp. 401]
MSSQPQQQPSANPPQGSNSYNRRGRGKYSKARKPAEQSDSLEQAQNRNEGRSRPSGPSVVPKSTRSRKFGGQLSSPTPEQSTATESVSKPGPSHRSTGASSRHESTGSTVYSQLDGVNVPDLTKKLIENLRTPPYADCVICFSPIHPLQPVWTCTVSEETNRCCWGVFHNKCIVAWSKKNIQETRAAYQARNEDKEAEWRCPGCQTPRTNPPGPYKYVAPN